MFTKNNYADLNASSQDPSQLLAQAANAAKNARKKEKRRKDAALRSEKQKEKPVESAQASQASVSEHGSCSTHAQSNATSHSVEALKRQVIKDASNRASWTAWDDWARRINAEGSERKYLDQNGRRLSFLEVLKSSNAIPHSAGHCIHSKLQPTDREQLASLLAICFPESGKSATQLAATVYETSQILERAPQNDKADASAVIQRIFERFQQAAQSSPGPGVDLTSLNKQIKEKQPSLQSFIAGTRIVDAKAVDVGMKVANLMKQKYDAESTQSSSQVSSVCLAAKADAQELASFLTAHAHAPAASRNAPAVTQELDSLISSLSAQVSSLEAQLVARRAELQSALAERQRTTNGSSKAPAPSASAAPAVQHIAENVESAIVNAAGVPSGASGNSDATLKQLLEHCCDCAKLQDQLMEKLSEDLKFAQGRLVKASSLREEGLLSSAHTLLDNLRASSSQAHDAAVTLAELVVTLGPSIQQSPAAHELHNAGVQVQILANRVCSAHEHLTAASQPTAILQDAAAAKRGSKQMSLQEILATKVREKSAANAPESGEPLAAAPTERPSPAVPAVPPPAAAPVFSAAVPVWANAAQQPSSMAPGGMVALPVPQPPLPMGMAVQPMPNAPAGYAMQGQVMPGIPHHSMPYAPSPYAQHMPLMPQQAMPPPAMQQPMVPVQQVVPQMVPVAAPPPMGGAVFPPGPPTEEPPAPPVHEPASGVAARFGDKVAAAEEAAEALQSILPQRSQAGPAANGRGAGRNGARGGARSFGGRGGRR